MILKTLSLTNFKNIAQTSLNFSPNINGLLGRNGMGKSNLLDAIYFLSLCKSFSGLTDEQLIRNGEAFAMLRGLYLRRGIDEELTLGMAKGKRKQLRRGGKEYRRLSEHIGNFPVVLVAPRDMELIGGSSEERRKFVDIIISQSDPVYLDRLIRYAALVQQRNRLLRDKADNPDLYASIELPLAAAADYITRSRARMIERFRPIFAKLYREISGTDETPSISYSSKMNDTGLPLEHLLAESRPKDLILGHTTVGPHRDDILLTLDGMPAKTTASQGQSKTFTIAMRLSQYEFLHEAAGMKPLLLLDDIFDKLDASRVANIVDIVSRDMFGQIFITDTNRDHLDSIMSRSAVDYRLWEVADGHFSELKSRGVGEVGSNSSAL